MNEDFLPPDTKWYRIYSEPSPKNKTLFIEIGIDGSITVTKQFPSETEELKFQFSSLDDLRGTLHGLTMATEFFIQSLKGSAKNG